MTLKDWLAENEVSRAEFGRRIERSIEAVRRYETGERVPDKETMSRIFRETDGAVTPNDFFDLDAPAPTTAPAPSEAA